jgi:protein SCO1/2
VHVHRPVVIALIAALLAGLGLWPASGLRAGRRRGRPRAWWAVPAPRAMPDFNLAQSDGTRLVPANWTATGRSCSSASPNCPDVCPTTLAELAQAQKRWQALPGRPRACCSCRSTPSATARQGSANTPYLPRDALAASGDLPALENFAASLQLVFGKARANISRNPNDVVEPPPPSPCSTPKAGWPG